MGFFYMTVGEWDSTPLFDNYKSILMGNISLYNISIIYYIYTHEFHIFLVLSSFLYYLLPVLSNSIPILKKSPSAPCFRGALAYAPSILPICMTTAAIGSPLAKWLLQNGARVIYHSPAAWRSEARAWDSRRECIGESSP